jgi:hypothetical protein
VENEPYSEDNWEEEKPIDWKTWGLGITAVTLLIGLIPFWFYIYIVMKP